MKKIFDFLLKKQYVIAGCLILCTGVGMTALYNYNQEQERARLEQEIAEQEQYVVEETQMESVVSVVPPKEDAINEKINEKINEIPLEEAVVDNSDGLLEEEVILSEPNQVAENTENSETAESAATAEHVAAAVSSLHFPAEEGLLWPMDGNVIMNYSMDATVYYATLDQYKYNPAIIIAGEVNNKVYSVAKGQITDISQNEVTGMTVTVDLGDGYQAIYGQLKELNFAEGDYLESGHVIGYVSEPTKYYSVEGSNLYFELRKDGEPIDPILFFE